MILDSSAIVAIVLREPGWENLVAKIAAGEPAGVGAPTLAESGLVLTVKMEKNARPLLVRFLDEASVTTIPFGDDHWRTAIEAYRRYGKGRHDAGLNFGDCLTYATAKLAGQPLLCTGQDFSKTDLPLA